MNIVIYARYSSDLQNEKSVDDQILLCKEFIVKNIPDGNLVRIFYDKEKSGSDNNREGINDLLQFIKNKNNAIKYIICEDISRISRSISFMGGFYEMCEFYNIKIKTILEGDINEIHIGLNGTMNAFQLKSLKQKILRGHSSRAREGRIVGLKYGYDLDFKVDEKNRPILGYRKINDAQASVIKMIFNDFANGISISGIVKKLNNLGIKSPSGSIWRINNILSSVKRQEGILLSQIYRGHYIYNRTLQKINPQTGHKHVEIKPKELWIEKDIPELRIIDEETWARVQYRILHEKNIRSKLLEKNSPIQRIISFPLTYLVYCGACNNIMNRAHESRYMCSFARLNKLVCQNTRTKTDLEIINKTIEFIENNIDINNMINIINEYYFNLEIEINVLLNQIKINNLSLNEAYDLLRLGLNKEKFMIDKINSLMKNISDDELKIKELDLLKKYKPINSEFIHEKIIFGLKNIIENIHDPVLAKPINQILKCFIEKITLYPITTKAQGSNIVVLMKNDINYFTAYITISKLW